MEGFIFGNLPLCVFLMLTSPLSRGHGSAPLLRRGDIPATPTLAKGNKLQQRSLNPCLARETRPPPARQPACSPRSPPRSPARSDPPGSAAAGNALGRWRDPGCGVHGAEDTDTRGIHRCPSASGDFWSCSGSHLSGERHGNGKSLIGYPMLAPELLDPLSPIQGFIIVLV